MKDWNDLAPRAEEILKEYNLKLKVHFRCRHLSIVLRILLESDLIFFCPKLTAEQLDERFIVIPIAEHLNRPSRDIGLFYANHYSSNPMTLWLGKAFKTLLTKRSERRTHTFIYFYQQMLSTCLLAERHCEYPLQIHF